MRVLVCGGRDYQDYETVRSTLDDLREDCYANGDVLEVIHGACETGADNLADRWCDEIDIKPDRFPADWYRSGRLDKSEGPRRNQRMIDEGKPALVVAFAGGRGTADMVRRAKKAGIPVREVQ